MSFIGPNRVHTSLILTSFCEALLENHYYFINILASDTISKQQHTLLVINTVNVMVQLFLIEPGE